MLGEEIISPMADQARVQVLMSQDEADRFNNYCREKGFKKSTLIVRLVREHMDREGYRPQRDLFENKKGQGER